MSNQPNIAIENADHFSWIKDFSTDMYRFENDDHPIVGAPVTKGGDGFNKQREMGIMSNLITDMTMRNASLSELERAVKHSMVVINAEKHQLDWKRSERENDIRELNGNIVEKVI